MNFQNYCENFSFSGALKKKRKKTNKKLRMCKYELEHDAQQIVHFR